MDKWTGIKRQNKNSLIEIAFFSKCILLIYFFNSIISIHSLEQVMWFKAQICLHLVGDLEVLQELKYLYK